jgi:uroporphyrin-III C-methyltransferase
MTLAELPQAASWQLAGPAILLIGDVYAGKLALAEPQRLVG